MFIPTDVENDVNDDKPFTTVKLKKKKDRPHSKFLLVP